MSERSVVTVASFDSLPPERRKERAGCGWMVVDENENDDNNSNEEGCILFVVDCHVGAVSKSNDQPYALEYAEKWIVNLSSILLLAKFGV